MSGPPNTISSGAHDSAHSGPLSEMMPPPLPLSTSTPSTSTIVQDGTTTAANTNPAAATPASELLILRAHIQTLTELNNRLQAIRHIPAQLLRPPGSDPHKFESTLLTHGFKEIGTIAETVRSEKVQDALKAARKSEQADSSNLGLNLRRENLKRRRPPSPESPQPYREKEAKDTSFLPSTDSDTAPIALDGLTEFIRSHNKSGKNKIHVVAPRKGRKLECPITLRLMVANVVTVFLMLDQGTRSDGPLVVESITAIGSREQKPPHSQSDFQAFQQLSQQLAKVIRSDPSASLRSYITLLSSYERLFVDTCSNCQRVISVEGHVPPVVRKWLNTADPKAPQWDVRHVVCKYEPPPPQASSSENGAANEGDGGGGEDARSSTV